MSGPILSAQARRQPQQTRLKAEWRQLGITEVFNGGVSTKGKLLYPKRVSTPIGLGAQIPITSNTIADTGVKVGAAWSVILALRIDSFVDSYVYALRPSAAAYGMAFRHASYTNHAAYYDGTNFHDSLLTIVPDQSVSTIGLTFDGTTYRWYKNGKQTNSTTGVSAGGGNWQFVGYVQTPTEGLATYPLIAFADRALSNTAMRQATGNPWRLLIERRVPGTEFGVPASSGLNGAVSSATTATATSTPTGTQTYVGVVSSASTAESASTPTGAQVYAGLVSGASTVTALSTPAGTVGSVGVVAPASTATSASTPTGTQSYAGLVAGASTATSADTPTGTQVYSGVVPAATTATALSTPTGTSGSLGAVAGASTATTAGAPTGSQIYAGLVSNAITATAAGTPTGAQVYAGLVASASTATSASTPAGNLGSLGVVAPASTAAFISTPAGAQSYAGAVSSANTATLTGTPTGAQSYIGVVSYASTTTSLSTPTGTLGVAPSPPNRTTLIQDVQALLSALAPAGGVFYGANTRGAPVVYPYITWQRIISVPNVTLQGPSDLQSTRIQVDIISRQINEADAILKNMTAGFQTWPVGNVPLSSQDLYDDVVQAYRITADWSVWARN